MLKISHYFYLEKVLVAKQVMHKMGGVNQSGITQFFPFNAENMDFYNWSAQTSEKFSSIFFSAKIPKRNAAVVNCYSMIVSKGFISA